MPHKFTLSNEEIFDALIIGGGPSGISAAIWCRDLGMSCLILEREAALYGQLRWINGRIRNYPGIDVANGAELIELFDRSAQSWGINAVTSLTVESIDFDAKIVKLADDQAFRAKVIFLATGVRRRTLGVPGEFEFRGKGILNSGTGERVSVKDQRVVVVGGGDAAAENAILLSEFAEKVYLVHRRATLGARMEFQERIEATPNIEVILESRIDQIGGTERVEWVDIASIDGRRTTRVQTDHFLTRIGVTPNTELFSPEIQTDQQGYIVVDELCRTNVRGVYAVGDVANPMSPTIPTAVGTGATAAKASFSLISAEKNV